MSAFKLTTNTARLGVVLEIDPDSGERVELISVTTEN